MMLDEWSIYNLEIYQHIVLIRQVELLYMSIFWLSAAAILALDASGGNALEPYCRTRRVFVSSIASVAVVSGSTIDSAKADSYNAFLPAGSQGFIQPYAEVVEGWSLPSRLSTNLGSSRILATSLTPLQQINPFASQELYYPSFLFGAWNVTTTLKEKIYPFGKQFVPSNSLIEGSPRNRDEKVGDSASFQLHFFSTMADTAANQLTVNLGLGVPEPKIIADRAYNAMAMSRGYRQLTPVEEVVWDYRNDPTRLTFLFGAAPVAEDMRPLGKRRCEIYLTARQSEASEDGTVFCASERSRSVTLASGVAVASDQETITEYKQVDEDTVVAIARISVFLTPNPNSREGVLWQQVGGNAVAFFDYTWTMKRLREAFVLDGDESRTVLRPCVQTPKDVVQCG
jgi:hypothetical protein